MVMLNLFQHPEHMPRSPHHYYVYILASKPHETLYIGVTNHIVRRTFEHVYGKSGFAEKYHVHHLVFFENYTDIREAIKREKQLKNWHRQWKINLIKQTNPQWKDLYTKII